MADRQVVIPRFAVLRRGEVIRTVPVSRRRLVVGSEDGANLRLKHPAIAPRHLEVTLVDGRFLEAANLAGEGRVLLGDQPMNRARLREGDELDLGPVVLRLDYVRQAAPIDEDEPTVDEPTVGGLDAPLPSAMLAAHTPEPEDETTDHGSPAPTFDGPGADVDSDVELDDQVLDPTPVVVIEPPGSRPQKVPLRVGSFVIGAGRCAFRLSYPGVAPAHAELLVMPDGLVYLKHLAGSGMTTLRNGAPVQFSRWMAGDRVQVGPVSLQLELHSREGSVERGGITEPRMRAAPPSSPRVPLVAGRTPLPSVTPAAMKAVPSAAVPLPTPPAPEVVEEPTQPDAPAPLSAPIDAPAAPPVAAAPPIAAPPPAAPPVAAPPPAAPAPPPVPAAPAAVAPPAAPAPAPGKIKVRKAPTRRRAPAPPESGIHVSLDIRSRDTFKAIVLDEAELEWRRPLWQRAALPVLMLVLLLLIGGQAMDIFGPDDGPDHAGGPRTASGESGLNSNAGDEAPSGRSVTVGTRASTKAAPRRGGGGGGGDRADGAPRNIDWEDERSGPFFEAVRRGERVDADVIRPTVADDVERDSATKAPESATGGKQGWVEMKDVERAIYQGRRKLKYCYTAARETSPNLSGILWLTLTLAEDGRVRGVVQEPRSTLKSDTMRKCMERQLYSLDMPKPRGGSVTFSYSWEFQSSN